jgi:hypothetical protein
MFAALHKPVRALEPEGPLFPVETASGNQTPADRRVSSGETGFPLGQDFLILNDRFVREHQSSPLSAEDHRLDGVQQNSVGYYGVSQFASPRKIIPGDLKGAFYQDGDGYSHNSKIEHRRDGSSALHLR